MSNMVKITRSKLESLSSAIRTKLGTDATKLTLSEMIADIPELAKPKTDIQPGTYDANGKLLKSWEKLIEDGDFDAPGGVAGDTPYIYGTLETSERFANVKKVVIDPSVKLIGKGSFYNCTDLVEVVILSGTEHISGDFDFGAFSGCSSLTTITIPNTVDSIEVLAFSGCTSLTEITIPNSVVFIGNGAFHDCPNLTTIHYSGTATGAPWGATNATVVP